MSVVVHASPEDAALAGLDPATIRDMGRDATQTPQRFLLGDAEAPADADPARTVRWLARPAAAADARAGGDRLIAPAGEGLWRRAPWPVADALFELDVNPLGAALVAGGDPARRAFLATELRNRGHEAGEAERLTRAALETAAVVLLPGDGEPDSPGPLPGEAMAVLAAGRVLVTGRCEPSFGLLPQIDWFPGAEDGDLVELADAALAYPDAFEVPRALGRLAAERHRASAVYSRLALDLELEAAAS